MNDRVLPFVKMEGLGNDYVYLDGIVGRLPDDLPGLSRRISDRHFGVGSDGLIVLLPGENDIPLRMRMFNADGSESEMCGNGIRCLAKYAYEAGHVTSQEFAVLTGAGVMRPQVLLDASGRVERVRVDMGRPQFGGTPEQAITVEGQTFEGVNISMGNPHFVIFVQDAEQFPVDQYGPLIETHPNFPHRTNVEFVEVRKSDDLVMRVWERGSGITLACGTGACAALVAARLTGRCDQRVIVHLLGGDLEVEWRSDGHVWMTGPAREVFRGQYWL